MQRAAERRGAMKQPEPTFKCQSFRQGCCGCCVNMRWGQDRVLRFLAENTRAARDVLGDRQRPRFRDLVRIHRRRRGIWDHWLATVLVMPTFGLSALLWRRMLGSCCFAGFIDEPAGRVGCLIHPARVGWPDLRRHAFPLIPTLGCDRGLICPMIRRESVDLTMDNIHTSQEGFRSLRP